MKYTFVIESLQLRERRVKFDEVVIDTSWTFDPRVINEYSGNILFLYACEQIKNLLLGDNYS